MVTFELWETRSANLVGAWLAEADALGTVRDAIDRHGAESVTTMALLVEDEQGRTTVVAEGSALVERARSQMIPPTQRTA